MRFNVCDLRKKMNKTKKRTVDLFFKNNQTEEVIFVGHSADGIKLYGLSSEDFSPNEDVYLVWLYCCHSANGLSPNLALNGYLTIGYVRRILAFSRREPIEIQYVQDNIGSLAGKEAQVAERELKNAIYRCARDQIKQGEFLLGAIINYNRLSMKVYKR